MPTTLSLQNEIKRLKRANRNLKYYLKNMCGAAAVTINALDKEMKNPSSVERGRRIGIICSRLEIEYDAARYFGLGEDLKRDKPHKKKD